MDPLDIYEKIQFLVQKEIDDKIVNYSSNARYNVAQIPAHSHNGVDSNRIVGTNLQEPLRQMYTGTFALGSNAYTKQDTNVNENSLIDVYAQATPKGNWTVVSYNGKFTITSTATETSNVVFKYYINN